MAFHSIGDRLPAICVEIDFANDPTNPSRSWTDVTTDVRQLTYTRSGRNDALQQTSTGTLTALLDNRSGDYDNTYTGGPYYPNVKRMRWIRVRAQWLGVTYARWQGMIEAWNQSWPAAGQDGVVAVNASDAMKVLSLTRVGNFDYPEQLSGERVASVCDDIEIVSSVDDGVSTIIETASGVDSIETTVLSHLQSVEETENGRLFAAADGTIVFQDRHHRLLNSATPIGVIGDSSQTAYYAAVIAGSPALYWRLGELSGTNANDETANNRDGTYVGSPTLGTAGGLAGDANTAITLNGSSQWITSTYAPFAAGSQRTFEGWAYQTNTSNHRELFGSSASTCMLRTQTGSTDMKFWPNSAGTQADWNAAWPGLNQWVHWVLTFDETANVAELYINGVSKGTRSLSTNWASNVATFVAGGRPGAATQAWAGRMDEIAIYGSILSAADVLAHYEAGTDATVASEIPYRETTLSYDDNNIWNDIKITPVDGTMESVTDVASQESYFPRTLSRNLLTESQTEALSAAEYLARIYADPSPKLPELVLIPIKATGFWPAVLAAENGDRFTFRRRPSYGLIELDGFVEQIRETVIPHTAWDVGLQLSPAVDQAFWVLGDAVYGRLGETTFLSY